MSKEKDAFELDQRTAAQIAKVVKNVEGGGLFYDEQYSTSSWSSVETVSSESGTGMLDAHAFEGELRNSNVEGDKSATPINHAYLKGNPALDEKLRLTMIKSVGNPGMNVTRQNLPTFAKKQEFLSLVDDNQVVVVSGETGSGKTTQLPQYLLEHNVLGGRGSRTRILVTQPRRISAISVAERVARERGQEVGEDVGYQIRFEKKLPRHLPGSILYCTTGIVLQFFLSEPLLQSVSHIFVDEVHEREIMGDILMTMLKRILPQRRDLRVILMSATLNSDKFCEFFDDCPHLEIPGRIFPVESLFLEDVLRETGYGMSAEELKRFKFKHLETHTSVCENIYEEFKEWIEKDCSDLSQNSREFLEALGVDRCPPSKFIAVVVDYIAKTCEPGAILVFVPGIADIQSVKKELKSIDRKFYRNSAKLYPLHSRLTTMRQRTVFSSVPDGKRKIVIATNIAETSITIKDIVYVVDSGAIKITTHDPRTNISTLGRVLVSKANATQREGRAGRVREGKCFHLFSRFSHDRIMQDFLSPEITRVRLEEVILRIKYLNWGSVTGFFFSCLDPPNRDAIIRGFRFLVEILALVPLSNSSENTHGPLFTNAIRAGRVEAVEGTLESSIEEENYKLTPLGHHLAYFLLPPQCTKLILLGALFCCLEPALAVAACLTFKDPFEVLVDQEGDAVEKQREFAGDTQSDHWAFYMAIHNFRSQKEEKPWGYCCSNYLDLFTMHDICQLMQYFASQLYQRKFITSENIDDPAMNRYSRSFHAFRAIIAGAFYPNYVMANPKGGIRGAIKCSGPVEEETIILHKKSVNAQATLDSTVFFAYFQKMKFGYQAPSTLMDTTVLDGRHVAFFSSKFMLNNNGSLKLDDWITLSLTPRIARLVEKLKHCFDLLLNDKMRHPGPTKWDSATTEGQVMQAVVNFFRSKAPEKRGRRRRLRRRGGGDGK
ncbi:hypothetical protein Aperf_G00000098542 [Anoplocephala perfoliata]